MKTKTGVSHFVVSPHELQEVNLLGLDRKCVSDSSRLHQRELQYSYTCSNQYAELVPQVLRDSARAPRVGICTVSEYSIRRNVAETGSPCIKIVSNSCSKAPDESGVNNVGGRMGPGVGVGGRALIECNA